MNSKDMTEEKTLLHLPAEILNHIIEYVTRESCPIDLNVSVASMDLSTIPVTYTWKLEPGIPPMALTWKAIYHDVCSIYFNENTFVWRCEVDDYDDRDLPLKQMRVLKAQVGRHARHLRHFIFTVDYMVQSSLTIRRSRFSMQLHMTEHGRISCERLFVGTPDNGRFVEQGLIKYCGCDLIARCANGDQRGFNLLEFAEDFIAGEAYESEFTSCDDCGLPKNKVNVS